MRFLKKTVLAAVCAVALASCSQKSDNGPAPEKAIKPVRQDKSLRFRTFEPNPTTTFDKTAGDCIAPPIECLPTMTPNGGASRFFSTLSAIQGGNTSTIQSAFSTNKVALLDYINEGAIDGVINGSLQVSMRNDYQTAPKYFLLFRDASTGNPYETYPFEN